MKWPRRDVQLFSMSFLDLLACALGGVLLLFIATMSTSQERIEGMEDEIAGLKAAIGLKGDLNNVVFLFDTSGSMEKEPNTGQIDPIYLDLLKSWVLHIDFERFNVIDFDTDAQPWSPDTLRSKTDRAQAITFIEAFEADGNTNTLGALQQAFMYEGVDTIILFSDGGPTPQQEGADPYVEVKEWLATNNRTGNDDPKIVVNTIGMGDYFTEAYGPFLREVARENGGEFVGR